RATGRARGGAGPPRPRPPAPPPPPPPAPRPRPPPAAGVPRRSHTQRCMPAVAGSGSVIGAHTVCTFNVFGSRGCGLSSLEYLRITVPEASRISSVTGLDEADFR